jgi:transposase-like protein
MYSYADRLRAVELYIRLGKRLKATIRQLGYPTKNALRGWYREYVENRLACSGGSSSTQIFQGPKAGCR